MAPLGSPHHGSNGRNGRADCEKSSGLFVGKGYFQWLGFFKSEVGCGNSEIPPDPVDMGRRTGKIFLPARRTTPWKRNEQSLKRFP
jgi:hypothetical protein